MASKKVNKVGKDFDKVVDEMRKLAPKFAKADGKEKEKILKKLKELTAKKKDLKAEIERTVMDAEKDVDLQIEIKQMIKSILSESLNIQPIGESITNMDPKANKLHQAISKAINQIDDSLNYKIFADAVALMMDDGYGTHNFDMFQDHLRMQLNTFRKQYQNESINEVATRSNIVQKWKNSDVVMSDMENFLEMLYKDGNYDTMDDMKNTFKVLSRLAGDYMKAMM